MSLDRLVDSEKQIETVTRANKIWLVKREHFKN